jgi:hypothetical protein
MNQLTDDASFKIDAAKLALGEALDNISAAVQAGPAAVVGMVGDAIPNLDQKFNTFKKLVVESPDMLKAGARAVASVPKAVATGVAGAGKGIATAARKAPDKIATGAKKAGKGFFKKIKNVRKLPGEALDAAKSGKDKVERVLRWGAVMTAISAVESVGESVSDAAAYLDPRTKADDYARRRERLSDEIETLGANDDLAADPRVREAMTDASELIATLEEGINAVQAEGEDVDYDVLYDLMGMTRRYVETRAKAAAAASARRDAAFPEMAKILSEVAARLENHDPDLPIARLDDWSDRFSEIRRRFYAPETEDVDIGHGVYPDLQKLNLQITQGISGVRQQRVALEARITEVSARITTMELGKQQRTEVMVLLDQARRQTAIQQWQAATAALDAVAQRVPQGPQSQPLTANDTTNMIAEVGRRCEALKRGNSSLTERVGAVEAKLQLAVRVAGTGTPESVATAAVKLTECREELTTIEAEAGARTAFNQERGALRVELDQVCDGLQARITARLGDGDQGADTQAGVALAAFRAHIAEMLPNLLTRAEYDRCALVPERAALEALVGELEGKNEAQVDDDKLIGTFQQARDTIQDRTEALETTDTSLISELGLYDRVPAIVARGEAAIDPLDAAAVTQATADLQAVLQQIDARGTENAAAVAALAAKGTSLIGPMRVTIQQQAQRLESKILITAEREQLAAYGTSLDDKTVALAKMLTSPDIGVVRSAVEDLEALQLQVASFVTRVAKASGDKHTPDPAMAKFTAQQDMIDKLRKRVEKRQGNPEYAQCGAELKAYLSRLDRYQAQINKTEPEKMRADLAALETEITATLNEASDDITLSKAQYKEAYPWLAQIMGPGMRTSDGYKEHAQFAASVRRRIEAHLESLKTTFVSNEAEHEALRTDLARIVNNDFASPEAAAANDNAVAEAEAVKQALAALTTFLKVDVPLAREKVGKLETNRQQKQGQSVIIDLRKRADAGIKELRESRDVEAATRLLARLKSEIDQVSAGGLGDFATAVGDLKKLAERWNRAATAMKEAARAAEGVITGECGNEPQPAQQDFVNAAGVVSNGLLRPLQNLVDPGVFDGPLDRLGASREGREQAREMVLREVRRLRGELTADRRLLRLREQTPFGFRLPVTELFDTLLDIENNVTRFG